MDALKKAFEEVSEALEKKQAECGLSGSNEVVAVLKSVQEKAAAKKDFPTVSKGIESILALQETLEKTIKRPSDLAPGGVFACLAVGYGDKVAQKLNALKCDAENLGQEFGDLKTVMERAFDGLVSSWGSVVPELDKQLAELLDLPKELVKVAKQCEGGFDEIANIDMGPIERSLDVSPLGGIASSIDGSKSTLSPAIKEVAELISKLSTFVKDSPKRVEDSFQVCSCIPTTAVAPPVYTTIMDELKDLKNVNLSRTTTVLDEMSKAVENFDVSKLLDPINDYAEFANKSLEKVTEALETAKKAAEAQQQLEQMGSRLHNFSEKIESKLPDKVHAKIDKVEEKFHAKMDKVEDKVGGFLKEAKFW
eukprot:CAMPEP_0194489964 /NCGR_PEP_ID=MMETSP0253-20130528/9339_1 /TAXON_ID=2966 /ORGANISM="Noctiluca scintillans" /LENGTH=364 /DNA_ID=CAMNT_0039330531 /DNA_START=57 /DNA_END=1151 /DNA_ORIENTATION=-